MKIATKRFLLGILAALFAVCAGFTVAFSVRNINAVSADNPTVENLTLSKIGQINTNTVHNDTTGIYGQTRVTSLHFTTGVFTGSTDNSTGAYDYSDIQSKTVYSGSSNTFGFVRANCTWPSGYKNSAVFNFFYFWTLNKPELGDTVKIPAGAYFTMAGTMADSSFCNDKYVLTNDILLYFNGTSWVVSTSFTLNGAYAEGNVWNGCYGSLYGYLDDWGIEREASSLGYWRPKTGTIIMTGPSSNVLASDRVDITDSITGIKYNGTELKDIEGAVIAQAFKNLVIYVPDVTDGVVTIDKYTFVGDKYAADDYAYVLSAKAAPNSDVIEWSVAHKITFDSNGGTAVAPIYVASGSTGVAPTAPTKANVGDTEYVFAGWIDENGDAYDFSAAVSADITLTATWTECSLVNITYDNINTWNSHQIGVLGYFTKIAFSGGAVGTGSSAARSGDFSNLKSSNNLTYTGLGTVDFWNGGYSGLGLASGDTMSDFIVMQITSAPAVGDKITIKAGAWFKVGGTDTNKYVIAEDIVLYYNASGLWQKNKQTTVYFSGVADYNNYKIGELGYFTKLIFTSGISTGSSGLSGNYSDLTTKLTYTGSGTVSFRNGGFGFAGETNTKSDTVYNFIVMQISESSVTGNSLTIPEGTWFTTGGTIEDTYVLGADIDISFGENSWPAAASFPVFDSRNSALLGRYFGARSGDDYVYVMPDISVDGVTVFGYGTLIGGDPYLLPAGGTYVSAENNVGFFAIIGDFDMVDGASIRITNAETSGIRWTANVSVGRDAIIWWGDATFGMEISAEGFSSNFDIKTNLWASDTTYNAVLTDINSDYYTTEFTAKAYVDIAYSGGTTTRFYANDTGITRSIRNVAIAALEDTGAGYTARQIEILTAIAGE